MCYVLEVRFCVVSEVGSGGSWWLGFGGFVDFNKGWKLSIMGCRGFKVLEVFCW